MTNYPSPCERCENNKNNCKHFRKCQPWLTRYKYRQKQINAFAKRLLTGKTEAREKTEKDQSPCLTCTRVKDPKNCGNKDCKEWREWFLKKWGELHNGK